MILACDARCHAGLRGWFAIWFAKSLHQPMSAYPAKFISGSDQCGLCVRDERLSPLTEMLTAGRANSSSRAAVVPVELQPTPQLEP